MKDILRDYWVSVAATVLLLIGVIVFKDALPRPFGLALLLGFVVYIFVVVRTAMKNKVNEEASDAPPPKPLWRCIILAIVGIAVIAAAGQLTVYSATELALVLGVSERIIGLTIVSIGTSLPELVTTLIACRKKEGEFALGLIIGSGIFNIMFVLGMAGTIIPLAIDPGAIFDIIALSVGTLLVFLFVKTKGKVARFEGILMVALYLAYMAWVVLL
jgi:cation:H+ antiporter